MATQQSTNPKDQFGRAKPDITSIPPAALIHEARAMQDGASKYGPYNWRAKTVATRVYLAAACRHIMSYLDGETNASDSGIHHLGHARASLGIVLDAESLGTLVDDRPMPGKAAALLAEFTKSIKGQKEPTATMSGLNHHTLQPLPERASKTTPITDFDAGNEHETPQENFTNRIRQKRRGYIAGPMRGYPKFNFPAFDTARDLAKSMGFEPISPADLDRGSGFHEDAPPMDALGPEITRQFVTRDTQALLSLRSENDDFIALLPGWEKSTGAVAEFFVARWLGLMILDGTTMRPFVQAELDNLTLTPLCRNVRTTLGDADSTIFHEETR